MPGNPRRAGCGNSSGAEPIEMVDVRAEQPVASTSVAEYSDDPRIAAAIGYARLEVDAYEQTESYWNRVWDVGGEA